LIDNEPKSSYIISLLLKINDFDVDLYFEPGSVLSDFKEGLYDLILISVENPATNGFELYRQLREIDSKVQVCFITHHRTRHIDKFTSLFPGMSLTRLSEKPVTSEDLLKLLRQCLTDVR